MSNVYQSQKKHTDQTREDRSESYFFALRKFHNSIKKTLYDKYCKNINNLLELASGKSGDMQKWISNNIKHVIGYDIDYDSIEEGKRRNKEAKVKTKGNFPDVELYVKDLSRNIIDKLPNNLLCDVVSSQFAFHYFFESESTFNTIIQSIKLNIKPDGIFMGTMFDGKSLMNLRTPESDIIELTDQGEIRFKLEFINTDSSIFGNKISVYIKDTVLDEPMNEYIVDFDSFVDLMKVNNFELIESRMFDTFYDDYKGKQLNSLQKEISFLNRTFVFKYRENSNCNIETDYLTECDWNSDEYNIVLLHKYLKGLDNKIKDSKNDDIKNKLLYIKSNFLNPNKIMENESKDIRDYYMYINEMYVKELR